MKVYVDELPKNCFDCFCCDLDLEECKIDKKIELCQDYFNSFEKKKPTKCPLQSLTDYTKQVRKEVCEEIKQKIEALIESKDFKLCNHEYANGYYYGYCYGLQYDLAKIIDQIKGETK